VIELLIGRGAFIHSEGSEGETPILLAAFSARVGGVQCLLARGAKPAMPSFLGHSLPWCCLVAPDPEGRQLFVDLVKKTPAVLKMKMDPFQR
jgi:hypothetical protein